VALAEIRPETPADRAAIRAVHRTSFPTGAEARLVDALRESGRLRLSLVAVDQDRVVGHVAFSPVTLAGAGDGAGLAPVAVLPEHRRRGIADQLIREGLDELGLAGCGFVVVLGDPGYYRRFGFEPAARWGLCDEYGAGDAFQTIELRPHAIPNGGGLVQYAPEFSALVDPTGP
jgi:putative acetyltransferase